MTGQLLTGVLLGLFLVDFGGQDFGGHNTRWALPGVKAGGRAKAGCHACSAGMFREFGGHNTE